MPQIAELFAARVPRYTSYPTAPHFHAGVTGGVTRSWLRALSPGALSLYVHIPFCDTLCWFCGCHTTVVNRYGPVSAYLDLLLKEIDLVSRALPPGQSVRHIHWGGGSPTMLRTEDIARLSSALHESFHVSRYAEFAVEIDPRGFRDENADALIAAGLTRASIGIQDCDAQVQRAINRIQSREETAKSVRMLRERGVKSLNLDLVYGLPNQTVAGFERTVDFALALDPDRLAVFGYAHVPHFKKHQALIPESALPGIEERYVQAEAARARICAAGYRAIGLDHFAKPDDSLAIAQHDGRLKRNFQGYTSDAAPVLIGLGASAISALPQGYAQNLADVPSYRAALEADRLPVARGIALTNEDRMRREIIGRLMCDLCVDLDAVAARHGATRDAFTDSWGEIEKLAAARIVSLDGGKIVVPEDWRAAVRIVCAAFDTHLKAGAAKHAVAV